MEMTRDDTKEMVNGGLSVQRLFFTASSTNIRRPILCSIHFSSRLRKPGPTPHCCPHHLNLASPSWVRSLCLTKRSKGKTKKKSNKKKTAPFLIACTLSESVPASSARSESKTNRKSAGNPVKGRKGLLHPAARPHSKRKTSKN